MWQARQCCGPARSHSKAHETTVNKNQDRASNFLRGDLARLTPIAGFVIFQG
jgi:hypothetical protein